MEKGTMFDRFVRGFREIRGEKIFKYDPNFSGNFRENPDGSVTVGKEQIQKAIAWAKTFQDREKNIAESAATGIGLSVAYIRKYFPEALNDVGYRE